MRLFLRTALLVCLGGLLASGCATNPVTGKAELTLVSEAEEIAIGQKQYLPAQQAQGGQYKVDEQLTRYVNTVVERLAAVSDRPLPYEIVVINDSTPNAWALPGGKMAINRGLLLELQNEAELAAVLGHEIIHAAARHGAKSVERSLLLQGAIMLTAIGSQDAEYGNYIVGAAGLGAQLIAQKYGRNTELEADLYGMEYMARAGYDPAAAISLQEKFVALNKGRQTSWLQGLFASHPPSAERVEQNRETAARIKAGSLRDWEIGEVRYRNALTYLASKADAYQAFDQARTLVSDKALDVAAGRVGQAIRQEPKEARFYGLKADILLRQGSIDDAIATYSKALAADSFYYEYYLGRGLAYARKGDRTRAQADLESSNQLLPTAMATNELGNLALATGNHSAAKRYYAEVAQSGGPLAQSARLAYVRLDLPENPAPYFRTSSGLRSGNFYAVISNQSGLALGGVTVLISARINGELKSARHQLGSMTAGSKKSVYPGWKIASDDVVGAVDVRLTQVSL